MSSIVKVDTIQENTSANGITVDGLNIKDSKLVTANSVVAANITADAIDATKIADNAISEEHLDVTSITGHTAETSIADGDTILIHDASASALRKMTKANFVSGIGGDNTPAFHVRLSGNQTLSHDTLTRITWDTEVFDTDNAFASNVFTVPSGKGGKYLFNFCVFGDDSDDTDTWTAYIEVDGSSNADSNVGLCSPRTGQNMILNKTVIITLTAGQVVEVVSKHQGTNQNEEVRSSGSYFAGFKLIGI